MILLFTSLLWLVVLEEIQLVQSNSILSQKSENNFKIGRQMIQPKNFGREVK